MRLESVTSEGLAQNSYYLSDRGQAIVIDPRRDCSIYLKFAKQDCAQIQYIFETHRNEDFVIGSLELQNITKAEIAHSSETPFTYGEYRLHDEDNFTIGNLQITAINTPGHTIDSICYTITDLQYKNQPILVFTGDTLFIGDVGRTDLPGLDIWQTMTEKLYDSIHDKLVPLGDSVLIYPGHGAGSICGHNISDREISTIGYERATNRFLQIDKQTFTQQVMSRKLYRPPYFRKMENYNLHGPPLLSDYPPALGFQQFEHQMQQPNTVILDTREQDAFAAAHISAAQNIWLHGVSYFPGWTLSYEQDIVLVTERPDDVEVATRFLWRLGFDNMKGYLCPGMTEWRNSGRPIQQLGALTASTLKEKIEVNELVVVDVREDEEWHEGHIEGARHIYVGEIPERSEELPRDKALATICHVGYRGSLAASILKQKGYTVYNLLGGINAWKKQGYPVLTT
jgi:hydroxyacylglutathione hydrolase